MWVCLLIAESPSFSSNPTVGYGSDAARECTVVGSSPTLKPAETALISRLAVPGRTRRDHLRHRPTHPTRTAPLQSRGSTDRLWHHISLPYQLEYVCAGSEQARNLRSVCYRRLPSS